MSAEEREEPAVERDAVEADEAVERDGAADPRDPEEHAEGRGERPGDAWIVALLFAIAFVYDTVEAVTNLQQLPLLYIGADIEAAIPWWLLVGGVALPGLLLGAALVLGRGRRIVAKAGILLLALAVSAQTSLLAEQLARQIAVAALGG